MTDRTHRETETIKAAASYRYPVNGDGAETVAILADGREVIINTQYDSVRPLGQHSDTCAQITQFGGVCDCGRLDGIDCEALIADAMERGLTGRAPEQETRQSEAAPASSVCPRCGTYCDGDCRANQES